MRVWDHLLECISLGQVADVMLCQASRFGPMVRVKGVASEWQ